jgi:hypothetical protein
METQSDRLHPGSLICDADKRLIFAPSFQLGSGGLGISQRYGTVWDGIRAKIMIFPSLVVPLQARADELLHRPGVAWSPLSIAETRPHELGQGLAAEIPSTTLRRGLSHDAVGLLKQRSPIFGRDPNFAKRPQSSICTNASGRAAAGRR